jgi:hypothetical protein
MKHLRKSLLMGAFISLVGVVFAQPPIHSGRGPLPFFVFDLNGDGAISRQEFEQVRAQRIRERAEQGYRMRNLQNAPPFSSIDGNGDGVVSPQEFVAAQVQHRQR